MIAHRGESVTESGFLFGIPAGGLARQFLRVHAQGQQHHQAEKAQQGWGASFIRVVPF